MGHADEGGDVDAETLRVEVGVITLDHAAVLELLDALDYGGCGEADLLADPGQRRAPAIVLQQREDAAVDVVQIELAA